MWLTKGHTSQEAPTSISGSSSHASSGIKSPKLLSKSFKAFLFSFSISFLYFSIFVTTSLFKKIENKEARKNVLNMPNEMIEEIIRDSKTESESILALEIGYNIEDIKETLVEIKNKNIIEIPKKIKTIRK